MSSEESIEDRFKAIRKHEQPKTHHECKCRECDPITSMAERADAFKTAQSLLSSQKWAEDDQPSVRETMMLADWLLYGPSSDD